MKRILKGINEISPSVLLLSRISWKKVEHQEKKETWNSDFSHQLIIFKALNYCEFSQTLSSLCSKNSILPKEVQDLKSEIFKNVFQYWKNKSLCIQILNLFLLKVLLSQNRSWHSAISIWDALGLFTVYAHVPLSLNQHVTKLPLPKTTPSSIWSISKHMHNFGLTNDVMSI